MASSISLAPLSHANLPTVTRITSLDLRKNGLSDLSPLNGMTELKYLMLDGNKITDLKVLVTMAERDNAGPKRFAPYWRIYLKDNPLSDDAKSKQTQSLSKIGARVHLK